MKSAAAMAGRAASSSGALPTSAMLGCGRRRRRFRCGSSANSRHSLQANFRINPQVLLPSKPAAGNASQMTTFLGNREHRLPTATRFLGLGLPGACEGCSQREPRQQRLRQLVRFFPLPGSGDARHAPCWLLHLRQQSGIDHSVHRSVALLASGVRGLPALLLLWRNCSGMLWKPKTAAC